MPRKEAAAGHPHAAPASEPDPDKAPPAGWNSADLEGRVAAGVAPPKVGGSAQLT